MQFPLVTRFAAALALAAGLSSLAHAQVEPGFTPLFDGKTLDGWVFTGKPGEGYKVRDGAIVCEKGTKGNLFTAKEYGDFILRLDFLCADPGANNGIGIRAPLEGDAAYLGMELQVLEEAGAEAKFGKLRDAQFHGSVYDCISAKRGAMKPVGQWNTQEIVAQGRNLRVTLNGQVILDADLNNFADVEKIAKHPGLFRPSGHIGFLGHDDHVEFRNIRLKELPAATPAPNAAPAGFTSLFNGKNLEGWKGLLAAPNDNPYKRAALTPDQLAAEQAKANELMAKNWKVENGALVYRGDGFDNLVTARDYANYELLCDWKIEPQGDSGLYLRGLPQVQIWEPASGGNPKKEGSGGFYNNQKSATGPAVFADRPVGEWNQFRVIVAGGKAHVFLNGRLVANGTALENFWDRQQPVPASGPLELQAHKNPVQFRNLAIREIK